MSPVDSIGPAPNTVRTIILNPLLTGTTPLVIDSLLVVPCQVKGLIPKHNAIELWTAVRIL